MTVTQLLQTHGVRRRAEVALIVFTLCLVLGGCGRGSDEPTKSAAPATDARESDAHKEPPNTVEVDEGMLRDLRVTTSPVESRSGGDLVVLLGELAVDQRAYAEVSSPVAARVTRLTCRRVRA
jgi:hypothetical protein